MDVKKIYRPYTPSRQDVDYLESTTTGRDDLLSDLLASIEAQTQKSTHQHWLLMGPRGIGKSHIIELLQHRIRTDPGLSAKWLPISFPEEAAGIITLRDFMEKVTRLAAQELESEGSSDEARKFDEILEATHAEAGDRKAINRIRASLIDWKDRNQRKILVMLENADRVIGKRIANKLPDEKWLRDILMNKDLLLFIATSPTFFKQVMNKDHPLYELFRVEVIDDLSFDESLDLLIKYADEEGRTDLVKAFKTRKNRIQAIYTLAGGNPRLLVMLYVLIQDSVANITDVEVGFHNLLEELTPYFQARMGQLEGQEEKVLVAFAEGPELLTPAEVGRKIRMATNVVTANLQKLQSAGFIKRIEKPIKGRKGTLYRLSETIYRYWYQMNSERNREMAEIFVRFIVLFYTYTEIEQMYASRSTRLLQEEKSAAAVTDAPRDLQYLEVALEVARQAEALRLMVLIKKAKEVYRPADEIRKIYHELIDLDPDDLAVLNQYGIFLAQTGDLERAISCFQESLELAEEAENIEDRSGVYNNWGNALSHLAKLKGDETLFRECFEKYALAVKYKEDNHQAYNNWGNALLYLAKLKGDETLFRECFEKYALAVKYKEDNHQAYNNWGTALSHLAKLKGDETLFRECFEKYALAVKYKEDNHEAYYNWGTALSDLAELKGDETLFRECFEKYALAVKYKEDNHEAYYNWGTALSDLAKLKGDETLFRECFEKYALAWNFIKELKRFDHPLMVNTALRTITSASLVGKEEEAGQIFMELAGSLSRVVDLKATIPYFFAFFESLARQGKAPVASTYLEQLFKTKFKKELNALTPFRFLFQYLEQKDDTIIRRQPPEMQKVLKEMINEIEKGEI